MDEPRRRASFALWFAFCAVAPLRVHAQSAAPEPAANAEGTALLPPSQPVQPPVAEGSGWPPQPAPPVAEGSATTQGAQPPVPQPPVPQPPAPQATQPPTPANGQSPARADATGVPRSVIEFPQPVKPFVRKHDFYYRQHLGLAGYHARFAPESGPSSLRGALDAGSAVGFALNDSVVLLADAHATIGGYRSERTSYLVDTFSIGPGVAYLWLDAGLYLSGSIAPVLGVHAYNLRFNGEDNLHWRSTSMGLSFNAIGGKEWQISDLPLGVGVAFFVRFALLKQGNFDAFGIAASATYY